MKLGYLCTGKGAPYLLLFDDADHHFKVVFFFTFLLKSLGFFVVFFVTPVCLLHDVLIDLN